jgi:hypothetical protein
MKEAIKTKEEARLIIVESGRDVESGMEYLNGLECYINGQVVYRVKDIESFINR